MIPDDTTIADDLYKKVRVLCWIMTSEGNLDKKAIHVKQTWGKRCNILLFASDSKNSTFGTIDIKVTKGYEHLTQKTMVTFDYVYKHYMNDADWFMKCDDDTYVIVENLRYFLSGEDPKAPKYFGHHFRPIVYGGYTSGGGGYVLSKEALRRYGTRDPAKKQCKKDGGAEDVEMGKCLSRLGVTVGDSRDALNRSRFHCLRPGAHIVGNYPRWYKQYDMHGAPKVSNRTCYSGKHLSKHGTLRLTQCWFNPLTAGAAYIRVFIFY